MATECIWLRQKQRRLGAVGKNSIKRCEGCPAGFLLGIVFWRVRGEGGGPDWDAGPNDRNASGQLLDRKPAGHGQGVGLAHPSWVQHVEIQVKVSEGIL
jgi:hypothetical protein